MKSLSPTPSEGEIVESESDKATKSLPSTIGIPVDRQSRKRVSVSRSPSPLSSGGRYNSRARSRSRSPFREHRGAKRSRDEDHYGRHARTDSRKFKVHYEERRHGDTGRGGSSYRDVDRGVGPDPRLRYDDCGSGRREKHPRSMSRSPPRFSSKVSDQGRHRNAKDNSRSDVGRSRNDRGPKEGRDRQSKAQSVSNRGQITIATVNSRPEAETRNHQTQSNFSSKLDSNGSADRTGIESAAQEKGESMDTDVPVIDEAALMEERRKRREAIKAKHRGQGTPLLVQALSLNNSAGPTSPKPDTPTASSRGIDSEKPSPPQTPRDTSGQESPSMFVVEKDESIANGIAQVNGDTVDDEPSAADYDPTVDMQEDKLRYESRQHGSEMLSSAYDETKNNRQDSLLPESAVDKPTAKQPQDEFDMFADEDENDIFAEEPSAAKRGDAVDDTAVAILVPRAKALDMSMLDDWDDEDGYYKIILGELLEGRYHVQLNLGKGMFSGVVRAMDQTANKLVAIKIIRNNETMKKAGLKEIKILEKIAMADPEDKKHMIRLERYFEHKGHLCMVFEHLSINLREVIRKFGREVGINLKAVRAYAHQMFLGLSLLRKCNILHADIKPDNVLVNESRNLLKICDLGSASDASDNEITPYLVSRYYRAPEIILGMPYDFAIDTWSIGCTLFELFAGKILFTGRTNNQMLRSIMECRGKFSHKILRKAQFAGLHFDDLLNFRSVEIDKLTGKDVVRILTFTKPTRDLKSRLMATSRGMAEPEVKELNQFIDLLDRCLNLNPEKRCTPSEALKHPFIMRSKV